MIKAVFLDMDDTLIVNQVLYDNARFMLAGYLRHFGILQQETDAALDKIDAELFKIHGISRFRYPATFEAVLKNFIPDADEEQTSIVRGFANTVFSTVANVKPGTEDALDILSSHYVLFLVTAGDDIVQNERISHLSFRDKFADVFIVDKKNKQAYLDCAIKSGYAPEEIVMIGDSLKSDVIPAVEAGMAGILVPASVSGSFHPLHTGTVALPEKGAYSFPSLLEAARHLAEHGTPHSKKFQIRAQGKPAVKPAIKPPIHKP